MIRILVSCWAVRTLVALLSGSKFATGRIFLDLLNEPDAFNFTWGQPNVNLLGHEVVSGTVVPWGDLYTETAALLLNQEPSLMFFLQGTGQALEPGSSRGKSTQSRN